MATEICTCPGVKGYGHAPRFNPLCPIHGAATELKKCICLSASDAKSYVRLTNPLCPVHGDVRDTGFVIDSKDDYITAIEDAIEELDR